MSVNFKTLSISLASSTTLTSGIDLGGTGYKHVYLEIPTFTSGGTQYVQTSSDGTTYRRLYAEANVSAGVLVQEFQMAQTVSACVVPLPMFGLRYIKLENTTGIAGTTTYKVIFG